MRYIQLLLAFAVFICLTSIANGRTIGHVCKNTDPYNSLISCSELGTRAPVRISALLNPGRTPNAGGAGSSRPNTNNNGQDSDQEMPDQDSASPAADANRDGVTPADRDNDQHEYAETSTSSFMTDYDMDNLDDHKFSEQQINQQTLDGGIRRDEFNEDLQRWRDAQPKPADRGVKSRVEDRRYTRETEQLAGGWRKDVITNDVDFPILTTKINAQDGRIEVEQSWGWEGGEQAKPRNENMFWSDLTMANWCTATNPEQRKNLRAIKRANINPQLFRTQDVEGDEMNLITPAAMRHCFETMGTRRADGKWEPLTLRAENVDGKPEQQFDKESKLYDLMVRQPHVDRVFHMLKDHRDELGDLEVSDIRLTHKDSDAGVWNIFIKLDDSGTTDVPENPGPSNAGSFGVFNANG